MLVTGASGGFGLEVARALGARGARVIAAARRADALEAVVGDLPGDGHLARPLDGFRSRRVGGTFAAIDGVGPLHGLVTAAGILRPIGALEEIEPRARTRRRPTFWERCSPCATVFRGYAGREDGR